MATFPASAGTGATPLHLAAVSGSEAVASALIRAGADPNAAGGRSGDPAAAGGSSSRAATGSTPLHVASRRGHTGVVRALMAAGARAEEEGASGTTPLIAACGAGHEETARALLECGASAETRDSQGNTPLLIAAWKGCTGAVEALLAAGASPAARAGGGYTPLFVASQARRRTRSITVSHERGALCTVMLCSTAAHLIATLCDPAGREAGVGAAAPGERGTRGRGGRQRGDASHRLRPGARLSLHAAASSCARACLLWGCSMTIQFKPTDWSE